MNTFKINTKTFILSAMALLMLTVLNTFAFTGPSQNPPAGNIVNSSFSLNVCGEGKALTNSDGGFKCKQDTVQIQEEQSIIQTIFEALRSGGDTEVSLSFCPEDKYLVGIRLDGTVKCLSKGVSAFPVSACEEGEVAVGFEGDEGDYRPQCVDLETLFSFEASQDKSNALSALATQLNCAEGDLVTKTASGGWACTSINWSDELDKVGEYEYCKEVVDLIRKDEYVFHGALDTTVPTNDHVFLVTVPSVGDLDIDYETGAESNRQITIVYSKTGSVVERFDNGMYKFEEPGEYKLVLLSVYEEVEYSYQVSLGITPFGEIEPALATTLNIDTEANAIDYSQSCKELREIDGAGILNIIDKSGTLAETIVISHPRTIGDTFDTTPRFNLSSSKPGTLSLTGDCSSSTNEIAQGTNYISLGYLSPRRNAYECDIQVIDNDGFAATGRVSARILTPLFRRIRSTEDCENLGGLVTGSGENKLCAFGDTTSCPTNWTRHSYIYKKVSSSRTQCGRCRRNAPGRSDHCDVWGSAGCYEYYTCNCHRVTTYKNVISAVKCY